MFNFFLDLLSQLMIDLKTQSVEHGEGHLMRKHCLVYILLGTFHIVVNQIHNLTNISRENDKCFLMKC